MREPKTDYRPEGSILLSAMLYGKWCEATHIATQAASFGHRVDIDAVPIDGVPHYFIAVGAL